MPQTGEGRVEYCTEFELYFFVHSCLQVDGFEDDSEGGLRDRKSPVLLLSKDVKLVTVFCDKDILSVES